MTKDKINEMWEFYQLIRKNVDFYPTHPGKDFNQNWTLNIHHIANFAKEYAAFIEKNKIEDIEND